MTATDLWAELTGEAAAPRPAGKKRDHGPGNRYGGRPINAPHEPTAANRERVAILVYLRTPLEIIADELGIGKKTLRQKYAYQLARGAELIAARLGVLAVEKALAGDRGMLGALTRARQIGKADEPRDRDTDGEEGTEQPLDLGALSEGELAAFLAALDGRPAGGAAGDGAGGVGEAAPQGDVDADPRKPAGKVPRKRR